jgi:mono/diheme cytochrome c family protein
MTPILTAPRDSWRALPTGEPDDRSQASCSPGGPTRNRRGTIVALVCFGLFGLIAAPGPSGARADDPARSPGFEREVRPILAAHCLKCHGGEVRKADLDLRSPGRMLQGGENGPALVKGSAGDSPLYEQVRTRAMPPGKVKLTDAQVAAIRDWINAGAPADQPESPSDSEPPARAAADRDYWAFRLLADPTPPPV